MVSPEEMRAAQESYSAAASKEDGRLDGVTPKERKALLNHRIGPDRCSACAGTIEHGTGRYVYKGGVFCIECAETACGSGSAWEGLDNLRTKRGEQNDAKAI